MQTNNQSKRKSANTFIKELSGNKHVKGLKEYQFYITLTKANVELIWCEEYEGQDAYTHPIYDNIVTRSKWMTDNRFVGFYSWRTSKESNSIKYNAAATKAGQTVYPRRYYLRIVDTDESTTHSRYSVLMECVKVRT